MINRLRTIRQSFVGDAKRGERGHKGYRFWRPDEAREQGFGHSPSRSRNRGRQPGSFKHRRDIVRRSRRRNRGAKQR